VVVSDVATTRTTIAAVRSGSFRVNDQREGGQA
jgi:hypothetical protein